MQPADVEHAGLDLAHRHLARGRRSARTHLPLAAREQLGVVDALGSRTPAARRPRPPRAARRAPPARPRRRRRRGRTPARAAPPRGDRGSWFTGPPRGRRPHAHEDRPDHRLGRHEPHPPWRLEPRVPRLRAGCRPGRTACHRGRSRCGNAAVSTSGSRYGSSRGVPFTNSLPAVHLDDVAGEPDHALDEVLVLGGGDADRLAQPVHDAAHQARGPARRSGSGSAKTITWPRWTSESPCRCGTRGCGRPARRVGSIEADGM